MPSLAAADLTHQGGWEHGAAVGMGSRAPVGSPRAPFLCRGFPDSRHDRNATQRDAVSEQSRRSRGGVADHAFRLWGSPYRFGGNEHFSVKDLEPFTSRKLRGTGAAIRNAER
jgi:hypothetical protein